jgi:transcriptional regulator with XRE-family HTH domain
VLSAHFLFFSQNIAILFSIGYNYIEKGGNRIMEKSTETNLGIINPLYKANSYIMASELNSDADIDVTQWLNKHKKDMIDETLTEHLNGLLLRKGIAVSDVVKNSGIDKSYVYQIFDGKRNPSRDKLIAIAIGMHMSIDETQETLKIAGYKELYPRQARDVVIFRSIKMNKTIFETDDALYELGLKPLLAKD